jgi:hypothetical protein
MCVLRGSCVQVHLLVCTSLHRDHGMRQEVVGALEPPAWVFVWGCFVLLVCGLDDRIDPEWYRDLLQYEGGITL